MKNIILFTSCFLLTTVACTDNSESALETQLLEYRDSDQELIGETLGAILYEYSQLGPETFAYKLRKLDLLKEKGTIEDMLILIGSDLPNSEKLSNNFRELIYRTKLLSEVNRNSISEAINIHFNRRTRKNHLKGFFSLWNTGNGGCGQRVFNAFMDTAIAIGATVALAPTGAGAVWAGIGVASEFGNLLVTANECSN